MTIEPNDQHAVLINQFEVHPDQSQELLLLLQQAIAYIKNLPGYVSAVLHVSFDRTRVVNYSQWTDADSFKAMLADPWVADSNKRMQAISRPDARLYRVSLVDKKD